MADKKNSGNGKYSERKWMTPSKRAEGYAKERKKRVHMRGPHEGEELDDYNKGLRSGYLLCQSDHAGHFKYKQALAEGKSKDEAAAISRQKRKK